jgi:tetraacyldisaccharide-1-P 4'-kinase
MGLAFSAHPFADHYDYRAEDLQFAGDAILTTEKDAVKLDPAFNFAAGLGIARDRRGKP